MLRFTWSVRPGKACNVSRLLNPGTHHNFTHLRLVEDFTTVMAFDNPTNRHYTSNATPVPCEAYFVAHFVLPLQRSSPLFVGGSHKKDTVYYISMTYELVSKNI